MKAVNLIPEDAGRAAGGISRASSATGAYVLLGVLAVLVAGVAAYVLTNNTVIDRRAELASLDVQVQAAQAQVESTRPYREFASLAQTRVQTVRQLGDSRFDWHRALSDFSKVVPDNVWLTSLLGTVTTGVNVDGAAAGSTGALRAALPNPAIELTGCTTSHDGVVRLISRLRLMRGVQRVALADSSKDAGAGGGGSEDCRHGHSYPQFDLVLFFEPLPAAPMADSGATSTGIASTQPAASATPAATGASSAPGSDVR